MLAFPPHAALLQLRALMRILHLMVYLPLFTTWGRSKMFTRASYYRRPTGWAGLMLLTPSTGAGMFLLTSFIMYLAYSGGTDCTISGRVIQYIPIASDIEAKQALLPATV